MINLLLEGVLLNSGPHGPKLVSAFQVLLAKFWWSYNPDSLIPTYVKEMLVPADDHSGLGRQGTCDEFVVIGICGNLLLIGGAAMISKLARISSITGFTSIGG